MGRGTNASEANRGIPPEVWLRYSLVVLLLAAALLAAVLSKARFLNNLGQLASIAVKVAFAYFLVEAAGFLYSHRKIPLCQFIQKRDDKPNDAASVVSEISEETRGTPSVQSVSESLTLSSTESQAVQDDQTDSHSGGQDVNIFEAKKHIYGQGEECASPPGQLRFGFHDTRNALSAIDGEHRRPIFLVLEKDGILVGRKTEEGQCIVVPDEECLTEEDLRYSPVTACFQIEESDRIGKKNRVRCEKPAILTETGSGLYEIAEKGVLTVISANR